MEAAEKHIKSLAKRRKEVNSYTDYWKSITPTDNESVYRRWLFAYLSVHTSWQRTVAVYKELNKLRDENGGFIPGQIESSENYQKEIFDEYDGLWPTLLHSGIGIHKRRHKGLLKLTDLFRAHPERFTFNFDNSTKYSDAIAQRVGVGYLMHGYGIALAKISFAAELCSPLYCPLVCIDTHIMRLYSVTNNSKPVIPGTNARPLHKGSLDEYTYRSIEKHWLNECRKVDVPCAIARHIWWDEQQGRTDTSYWSNVFEGDNYVEPRAIE